MDEADVLHSSADKKRRLFEEKLAQEQEEREMKKVGATAKKPAPLKQEKVFTYNDINANYINKCFSTLHLYIFVCLQWIFCRRNFELNS